MSLSSVKEVWDWLKALCDTDPITFGKKFYESQLSVNPRQHFRIKYPEDQENASLAQQEQNVIELSYDDVKKFFETETFDHLQYHQQGFFERICLEMYKAQPFMQEEWLQVAKQMWEKNRDKAMKNLTKADIMILESNVDSFFNNENSGFRSYDPLRKILYQELVEKNPNNDDDNGDDEEDTEDDDGNYYSRRHEATDWRLEISISITKYLEVTIIGYMSSTR
jgi:hypothetical protein